MTYSVIYADPPWSYGDKGFGKRSDGASSGSFAPESGRYATMSVSEIKSLGTNVRAVSNTNAALLLWATSPLLSEALEVVDAWGFKYKTIAFVWSKISKHGKVISNLGQWTLGNVEVCLLGTKGRPQRIRRDIKQFAQAERTIHSEKPAVFRSRIEELFGNVPRLEMFARAVTPGWDVWGDEVTSNVHIGGRPIDYDFLMS